VANESSTSEFSRLAAQHEAWLLYTLVGTEVLTSADLTDVQLCKSLPVKPSLSLVTSAYLLGKRYAHANSSVYKSLTLQDVSTADLTSADHVTLKALRMDAVREIHQLLGHVRVAVENRVHKSSTVDHEILSTFFTDLCEGVVAGLISKAKNAGQLAAIAQGEGIYSEAMNSRVAVLYGDKCSTFPIGDLLNKSLQGTSLYYIPPGSNFANGKLEITDIAMFNDALSKASAGVSGGISPTVEPKGPPQPKQAASPGSISGVAAPGNVAGPGRPQDPSGVEYEYRDKALVPKGSPGWEPVGAGSSSMKRPKGMGGGGGTKEEEDTPENRQATEDMAAAWGKKPKPVTEALQHLSSSNITHIKELGTNEQAGITTAYRVLLEGNGHGLMKPTNFIDDESYYEKLSSSQGSVPRNSGPAHEVGAYNVHTMLGVNTTPPTTTRSHEGAVHSMQSWQEGCTVTSVHTKDTMDTAKNRLEAVMATVPETHKDHIMTQLMNTVVADIVTNNTDRHWNNLMFSADGTSVKTIDHAESFGTGMKGNSSALHQGFARAGKKVVIPHRLQTALKNKTYGDYKRAAGSHLQDWQVAQTYLRSQYVLHLQETEGHIDPDKFIKTQSNGLGTNEIPDEDPGKNPKRYALAYKQMENSRSNGVLPNQLFESFAKKWIEDNKANSTSPNHATANELDTLGVFMPPESTDDPTAYRKTGAHHEYAKGIVARNPPANIFSGEAAPNNPRWTSTTAGSPPAANQPDHDIATARPTRLGRKKVKKGIETALHQQGGAASIPSVATKRAYTKKVK